MEIDAKAYDGNVAPVGNKKNINAENCFDLSFV